MRKSENKYYHSVPTGRVIENYKKIEKKKKKKTIMAAFQAKLDWKMLRNVENKNYRFVQFLPDASLKIQKKWQNN